jgi:hypothetical protein
MDVIKVREVDADAYIAVRDDKGDFRVNGDVCRIYNAMPGQPGPRWRDSFMRGEVAYTRWEVTIHNGKVWDSAGGRDIRGVEALGATIIQRLWPKSG